MENLELEYDTIENADLADRIRENYDKRTSLSYEHVTLLKTETWAKDNTIVNANINVPRKSMRAIVMLFTTPNPTDSEQFVYPNIEGVKVTIEGVPNSVYSQGIQKNSLYGEAKTLGSGGRT